ncbi:MAG: hypothetical protein ACKO96_27755 [Flammeovirgaceae bacterium]
MVKRELASGIVNDSIFLGIRFGMGNKDFSNHCRILNNKQILVEGLGFTAQYQLHLKQEAAMDFYPNFYEGKIYEMPTDFYYKGWNPTHPSLQSDSLMEEVRSLCETWYRTKFIKMYSPQNKLIYASVQGNRQLLIYVKDVKSVRLMISDLRVKQKISNEK